MKQVKFGRRWLYGVLAAGTLLGSASGAMAATQCTDDHDQQAFEMVGLKTALMVVAMTCDTTDKYNSFIRRYQSSLQDTDKSLSGYFKRRYGARGQTEYDRYATDLANVQSRGGLGQGVDFCQRNATMFEEVQALKTSADLPQYAAAKDLIPDSLGSCPGVTTAAAAPTKKSAKK
jgi:hypothetical protein